MTLFDRLVQRVNVVDDATCGMTLPPVRRADDPASFAGGLGPSRGVGHDRFGLEGVFRRRSSDSRGAGCAGGGAVTVAVLISSTAAVVAPTRVDGFGASGGGRRSGGGLVVIVGVGRGTTTVPASRALLGRSAVTAGGGALAPSPVPPVGPRSRRFPPPAIAGPAAGTGGSAPLVVAGTLGLGPRSIPPPYRVLVLGPIVRPQPVAVDLLLLPAGEADHVVRAILLVAVQPHHDRAEVIPLGGIVEDLVPRGVAGGLDQAAGGDGSSGSSSCSTRCGGGRIHGGGIIVRARSGAGRIRIFLYRVVRLFLGVRRRRGIVGPIDGTIGIATFLGGSWRHGHFILLRR